MKNHLRALTLITALLGSLVSTQAQVISPSNYSLLSISGTWAYGQTDWNDIAGAGPVNNATDVAVVNGLLSDGYAFSPAAVGPVNGIYSAYPGFGFDTLVFTFNGGAAFDISGISFLSSRSYSNSTVLGFDYSFGGGPWLNAASVTAGALGISTGSALSYTLFSGGPVLADSFRLTFQSDQISLHELTGSGTPAFVAVPEPSTYGLIGSVLLIGVVALRRRFSKAA